MIRIKTTEEYRVDTENEAKAEMEKFRQGQAEGGYILSFCGYTYKEKKLKGEVIDSGYLIKVIKTHNGFWI